MEFKTGTIDNKALFRAMESLPKAIRNRALRKGLRAAAQVVRDKAADNIRSLVSDAATGLAARSVVVRARKQTRQAIGVRVAVNKSVSKKGSRVGLYMSVFEFGKENQPPRPWLRPAAAQKADESVNVLVRETSRLLPEAVEAAKRGSP